jgi:hypothetical protein
VEVFKSALRHDVAVEEIQHAVRNALAVEDLDDDPIRYLVLGPDQAGNLLEVVVLDRPDGPVVIHAMRMRPQYQRLLPGRRRRR